MFNYLQTGIPFLSALLLLIILAAVVFIVYWFLSGLSAKTYSPALWQQYKAAGRIHPELQSLEKNYPDKVRFFNIWFQIERIKLENIAGSLAEAGVYQGDTAKVIHFCAPDKTLWLLDTYCGFPSSDLIGETGEAATYTSNHFADTSLQKVKDYVGISNNIQFVQGKIPECLTSIENETFSFVSLDLDLYLPTKASLDFFYPRLNPGGVILVHDYNEKWPGIMKACMEFSQQHQLHSVFIPDQDGTVMFFKPV